MNKILGFMIAGVAIIFAMLLGDLPGLAEFFMWAVGDDALVNPRPAYKYVATALMGCLLVYMAGRIVLIGFTRSSEEK